MSIPTDVFKFLSVILERLYTTQDLETLMLTVTGDDLYQEWVGKGMPTRATIYSLLKNLDEEGLAEMLLRRPHAEELRALLEWVAPNRAHPAAAPQGRTLGTGGGRANSRPAQQRFCARAAEEC